MTTDPNIKAACERLRRFDDAKDQYDAMAVYDTDQGLHCDRAKLAKAYYQENPADSDELVDDAWLRSVGFETHGTITHYKQSEGAGPAYELGICLSGGCYGCCIRQRSGGVVYATSILMPETRGDVRDLCRCLGIELKETP